MGFLSWLTGRDEKESDVYANFDKVADVVSNIKNIGTNEVESARDEINDALDALNNVNGVAQYVGTVTPGAFNGVFESVASSITQIGDQLQSKADDIKVYEESSWLEKLGSSICMGAAKLGEGILSVAEDLGDGIVSVVGWVAPKDSGLENACKGFVEKEWSHDAFNFYYNSEFAKKSTFTEDSGAASALKITGAVAGTIALTAATMGAGEALAGVSTATKAGAIAAKAGTIMQSGLKVSTGIAALSGMGSGTEAGLKRGLDFDGAAWEGAKQGAVQGAIAYGVGKVSLGIADKAQGGQVADAKAALKAGTGTQAQVTEAQLALEKSVYAGGKLGSKAYDVGYSGMKNVVENGVVKGTMMNAGAVLKGAAAVPGKAVGAVKDGVAAAKDGITGAVNTVKNGGIKTAVSEGAGKISSGAKAVGETVKNAVTHPVDTIKSVPGAIKGAAGAVAGAAGKVGTALATPTTAVVLNATGRELVSKSSDMFHVNEAVVTAAGAGDKVREDSYRRTNYYDFDDDQQIGNYYDQVDPLPEPQPTGIDGGGGNTGGSLPPAQYTGGGSGYQPVSTQPTEAQFKSTDQPQQEEVKKQDPTPTAQETPTNGAGDNFQPQNQPQQQQPQQQIVNPAGGQPQQQTVHSGGGYSGGGYSSYTPENTENGGFDASSLEEAEVVNPVEEAAKSNVTSIDDIIKGNKYTKIPTSNKPITTGNQQKQSSGGGAVIPIAAGLSAAAAAGIGAKAYIDRKNSNDNGEDDFDSEEWTGDEDSLEIDYSDSGNVEADTFDEDDDYGYQEEVGYSARNNEELADMQ